MGASRSKPALKEDASSINEEAKGNIAGNICQKISKDEFDNQRLMGAGGTSENIKKLFDAIVEDETLSLQFRYEKLKQFKVEYPFIYKDKSGDEVLQRVKSALKEKKAKERNRVANFLKIN